MDNKPILKAKVIIKGIGKQIRAGNDFKESYTDYFIDCKSLNWRLKSFYVVLNFSVAILLRDFSSGCERRDIID